jgi:putative ABC transport system ATP-binding protein
MIELDHVSRTYVMGDEVLSALDDVSEVIGSGEYVAVMGPSGSGKSTLLHVLGCLDRPSSGVYRLDGQDVGGLAEDELSAVRRNKIGFVFQTFHLVSRLDALENVALPMIFAGVPRAERSARAEAALSAVGLLRRAGHRPSQLSGGERQRVAIARATVMGPQVLLADEPTGNLDTAAGRQVMDLLEGMCAAGLTLVVVTHDPVVAARAGRMLVMRDGRIVERRARAEAAAPAPPAPAPGAAP